MPARQKREVKRLKSVLFNLAKGLLYGSAVGLILGFALYLLAAAVDVIVVLAVTPAQIFSLIFATGVLIGVAKEYDVWLEAQEK